MVGDEEYHAKAGILSIYQLELHINMKHVMVVAMNFYV